jgi:sterol desaturase/sphingolipid hydroxylase (fatty acid hydroxylase superfamily)
MIVMRIRPNLGALAVLTSFALLWWIERKRPLRPTVEPPPRRHARNLTIAALAAVTVHVAERPLVEPLADRVEARRWGLLKRAPLPRWLETVAGLVLLDYTLYLWHVLVHRVPALWRFHAVHHVDLDLDASTAVRFHAGELLISVPWRAMQVCIIGVSPATLTLWQRLLLIEILFHHSNVRLPQRLERALSRLVVTPRLHGIHHANRELIRNVNWSSGLTVWDWLHGTLRDDIPQDEIVIGVEGFHDPRDVTLPRVLAMPFERSQESGVRS